MSLKPQADSDFRSDTVTQPTPAMRQAMQCAPLGDDVFADDPSVNALQASTAERLGFEAAIFAPSGTMTNLMALMSHCERGDEVICGQQWHTYRWEGGGMAVLGSIQPQPLEHDSDGSLALHAIEAAIKPNDPHFARTRLIAMENTTGGRVLGQAYLEQVAQLAKQHGLAMHLDGARLFNAATAWASAGGNPSPADPASVWRAARDMCAPFDTVSVCLSKGLGAPVGSLLLGSHAAIGKARRIRKMLGGGMRQAGVLAAAGQHALDHHVARLAQDHALMQTLAQGLDQAAAQNAHLAQHVTVHAPHTNICFTRVSANVAKALQAHLQASGVRVTSGPAGLRWVTHLDVHEADVQRAVAAVAAFGR